MKTLKMLVLAVAIAFSSSVSANTNPIKKAEPNSITETVSKLLEKPDFQLNEDTKAMVQIAINQNNEMVVLSVDTEDEALEGFLKGRLNYKKVELQNAKEGKLYTIPVRITA